MFNIYSMQTNLDLKFYSCIAVVAFVPHSLKNQKHHDNPSGSLFIPTEFLTVPLPQVPSSP